METDSALPSKKTRIPRRSLFFHPYRPHASQVLEHVRRYAGWDYASSPETADCCILFQDSTWVTLPDSDPYAAIASTWINGRCRDISKRTVELVFDAVFGYPLAIDPLTHQGICLRKSNRNFVLVNGGKDVQLLPCPMPADAIDEQYVYERLVDGRVPGLGIVALAAYVVGGEVVSVLKLFTRDWISAGVFADGALDVAVVYPASVFSTQELEEIAIFCHAMGLDYGKLDIIRDTEEQRLYILDANTTPAFGTRRSVHRFVVEQLAWAFVERYPPRATAPTVPPRSGKKHPQKRKP